MLSPEEVRSKYNKLSDQKQYHFLRLQKFIEKLPKAGLSMAAPGAGRAAAGGGTKKMKMMNNKSSSTTGATVGATTSKGTTNKKKTSSSSVTNIKGKQSKNSTATSSNKKKLGEQFRNSDLTQAVCQDLSEGKKHAKETGAPSGTKTSKAAPGGGASATNANGTATAQPTPSDALSFMFGGGGRSTTAAIGNKPNTTSKNQLLDVGYNGAEMTLQLLDQRQRQASLRFGWVRHPEMQKKCAEFLVNHCKLAKTARLKVKENAGNTMFKASFAQLEEFEKELKEFVLEGKTPGATSASSANGFLMKSNPSSSTGNATASIFTTPAPGSIFSSAGTAPGGAGGPMKSIFSSAAAGTTAGTATALATAQAPSSSTSGPAKTSRAEKLLRKIRGGGSGTNKSIFKKQDFTVRREICPQKASELFKLTCKKEKEEALNKGNKSAKTNKASVKLQKLRAAQGGKKTAVRKRR
ncbi:unnamed protein product [Amoebophrya sp. A120]|nr:unnamed protein product [Amoebophrya sp. A120]|eukprot:GSA120T00014247001.1